MAKAVISARGYLHKKSKVSWQIGGVNQDPANLREQKPGAFTGHSPNLGVKRPRTTFQVVPTLEIHSQINLSISPGRNSKGK